MRETQERLGDGKERRKHRREEKTQDGDRRDGPESARYKRTGNGGRMHLLQIPVCLPVGLRRVPADKHMRAAGRGTEFRQAKTDSCRRAEEIRRKERTGSRRAASTDKLYPVDAQNLRNGNE